MFDPGGEFDIIGINLWRFRLREEIACFSFAAREKKNMRLYDINSAHEHVRKMKALYARELGREILVNINNPPPEGIPGWGGFIYLKVTLKKQKVF